MNQTDKNSTGLADRMSGEISLLEIILRLSSQEQSMKEIKEKLAGIDEIKQAVLILTSEGKMRKSDFDNLQRASTVVQGHNVLLKLLTGLCVILFPTLLGWAIYITKQVIDINTRTQIHEIKLKVLEDKGDNNPFRQTPDGKPGNVWYYALPERIEI